MYVEVIHILHSRLLMNHGYGILINQMVNLMYKIKQKNKHIIIKACQEHLLSFKVKILSQQVNNYVHHWHNKVSELF